MTRRTRETPVPEWAQARMALLERERDDLQRQRDDALAQLRACEEGAFSSDSRVAILQAENDRMRQRIERSCQCTNPVDRIARAVELQRKINALPGTADEPSVPLRTWSGWTG